MVAISHDSVQRCENERRAVDMLLKAALGRSVNLSHRPSGAPYIAGSGLKISISHSRDYACLAVSSGLAPGVDVEQPRMQLQRVAARVLSQSELAIYGKSIDLLLRAWTLKEALYKAALTEGLDFRKDICLPLSLESDTAYVKDAPYRILMVDCDSLRTVALTQALEQCVEAPQ